MKQFVRKKRSAARSGGTRPLFWKIYLGVVAGFAFLLVIGAVVFWSWLNDYQHSQRTKIVEEVVSLLQQKQYVELIEQSTLAGEEFESKDGYADKLEEAIGGRSVHYAKAFSADRDEQPMFYVMAGEQRVLKVVLKPQEKKSRFGFRLYELDYLTEFSFAKEEVKVVVPEGCQVLLNGVAVPSKWIVKDRMEGPDIKYALGEDSSPCMLRRYHVTGLLKQPEITVQSAEGAAVEMTKKDQEYVLPYLEMTLTAPSNAAVFVNGQEISASDQWRLEDETEVEQLKNVPDGYLTKPVMVRYKVTGIVGRPEIRVVNCLGETIAVQENPEKGTVTAGFDAGEETLNQYRDTVISLSQMYSKFVTNDLSKTQMLQKILPDCAMYQEIRGFNQTFYTDHFKYWFENVVTENIQFYTENCFSCEISYDHWIQGIKTDPNLKENLESHFRFVFVKSEGSWYLADWEIL